MFNFKSTIDNRQSTIDNRQCCFNLKAKEFNTLNITKKAKTAGLKANLKQGKTNSRIESSFSDLPSSSSSKLRLFSISNINPIMVDPQNLTKHLKYFSFGEK